MEHQQSVKYKSITIQLCILHAGSIHEKKKEEREMEAFIISLLK
jgi:hypothetical protein